MYIGAPREKAGEHTRTTCALLFLSRFFILRHFKVTFHLQLYCFSAKLITVSRGHHYHHELLNYSLDTVNKKKLQTSLIFSRQTHRRAPRAGTSRRAGNEKKVQVREEERTKGARARGAERKRQSYTREYPPPLHTHTRTPVHRAQRCRECRRLAG